MRWIHATYTPDPGQATVKANIKHKVQSNSHGRVTVSIRRVG
jgi:hypothetical protein